MQSWRASMILISVKKYIFKITIIKLSPSRRERILRALVII